MALCVQVLLTDASLAYSGLDGSGGGLNDLGEWTWSFTIPLLPLHDLG